MYFVLKAGLKTIKLELLNQSNLKYKNQRLLLPGRGKIIKP